MDLENHDPASTYSSAAVMAIILVKIAVFIATVPFVI